MAGPQAVGSVRTEGARIHFEVYDQRPAPAGGDPLVLLHGNGEDLHILDTQVDAFSRHHRVVAVDTRGHGRSSAGQLPWDFPLFARDVLAVLDHVGAGRAHVFGFSDGGNTALHLVAAAPHRLASVVVVGANLDPSGLAPLVRAGMVAARARWRALGVLSRGARDRARLYGLMLDHPHLDPARLRGAAVPALVVAGQRDVVRPAHTRLIAQSLGAQLEVLAGAGHMVPVQRPAQCNRLVLDFLARRG